MAGTSGPGRNRQPSADFFSDLEARAKEIADLNEVLRQRDAKLAEAQQAQVDLIRNRSSVNGLTVPPPSTARARQVRAFPRAPIHASFRLAAAMKLRPNAQPLHGRDAGGPTVLAAAASPPRRSCHAWMDLMLRGPAGGFWRPATVLLPRCRLRGAARC
jgi:hypothetical protein